MAACQGEPWSRANTKAQRRSGQVLDPGRHPGAHPTDQAARRSGTDQGKPDEHTARGIEIQVEGFSDVAWTGAAGKRDTDVTSSLIPPGPPSSKSAMQWNGAKYEMGRVAPSRPRPARTAGRAVTCLLSDPSSVQPGPQGCIGIGVASPCTPTCAARPAITAARASGSQPIHANRREIPCVR